LTAFAAIAIAEPALLLLDEPTRGLDYDAKNRLLHALHRRRANGVAILLVTHDIEWAVQLADRVIMLSQGEILADGMPRALLPASPLFAPQVARLFPDSGWLTVTDAEEGMHANS
jgi:energy-coupling factor transport system ATP-binding protein